MFAVLHGQSDPALAQDEAPAPVNISVVQKSPPPPIHKAVAKAPPVALPAHPKAIPSVASDYAEQKIHGTTNAMPQNNPTDSVGLAAKTSPVNQDVAIDVPLKHEGIYLGDVSITLRANGDVLVKADGLAPLLKKIMKPEALTRVLQQTSAGSSAADEKSEHKGGLIEVVKTANSASASQISTVSASVGNTAIAQKGSETPAQADAQAHSKGITGYIHLRDLATRGLAFAYDAQASELSVAPSIDQKLDGSVSLGGASVAQVSVNAQPPAFFSAYVNTRAVVAYATQGASAAKGVDRPSFDFDSAVRVGAFVVESEAALTPRLSQQTFADGGYEVTRRGSRLIYDREQDVVRYKAGDLSPAYTSFQSAPDILGVSAERVHAHFKPGQNIRPTGQHTFRLERPSNVDILADGVILRRLRLDAGNYNINDLPIRPGATKLELVIEEDTGNRRTLEFTNFGGQDLLAPGIDEWQIAAGVQSFRGVTHVAKIVPYAPVSYGGPRYDPETPIATALYRTGLTPALTASIHGQASRDVAMAGSGIATQTVYGYVSLDVSASFLFGSADAHPLSLRSHAAHGAKDIAPGPGFAVRSAYELLNIRGEDGRSHSFRVSGEYQSANFATINHYAAPRDYSVSLALLYSRELSDTLTASLSGSMFLLRDDIWSPQRWDVDVTLSKRFAADLSGALSIGAGEGGSGFRSAVPCVCENRAEPGLRAFLRLTYRLDNQATVTASHDTRHETSRATYMQNGGSGVGAWSAVVDAAHDGSDASGDVNAGFDYTGNRGEISVSHATRLDGVGVNKLDPKSTSERTALRLETGFATADGAWTFGRPIRNSFAIVEPHETLKGHELILGMRESEIGRSDRVAAALIPDISPYTSRRVMIDAEALPAGYDLGAGSFDFHGPYKAGYRVEAGSAYTITAVGTLVDAERKPIALLEGAAQEIGRTPARRVSLFTNRAGRFGAQGLSPGKWVIEMPADRGPIRYAVDVPANATNLVDLGELKPRD